MTSKFSGSDGGTCIGTTKTEREDTIEASLSTAVLEMPNAKAARYVIHD